MSGRARLGLLVIVLLVVTAPALSGPVAADGHEGYVVEQGDQCVPVEPISHDDETVEEFYDYRASESQFSSQASQEIQDDDASLLALYEGPDGLSLVIVHDRWHRDWTDGTTGGTVSFEVTGLPPGGEWTVEDDDYDDQTDEFYHQATESRMHWIWNAGRTDGAAFTGLGSSFAVEIEPRFNDDARFEPRFDREDGTIDDWQVIVPSADGEGFERVSLDSLDESVTIRPGACHSESVDGSAPVGPATDLAEGVAVESVWVRTDADVSRFDAAVTSDGTAWPPGAFPNETAAFAIETDDPVDTMTVTLAVDRELLETAELDPDDLVLYGRVDGEWTSLDTAVDEGGDALDADDDAVYLRAEADAEATIGLGTSAPIVTDVTVEDAVAGEPFDMRVEIENAGEDAQEIEIPVLIDGERVGEASATVPPGETTETTLTTTVEEPGESTIAAGTVERTVTVVEATTHLHLTDVSVEDDRVEAGEETEVVVVVQNYGTAPGEYTANFTIDGGIAAVKTVTVGPDEPARITFTQSFAEPGTYEVGVDGNTRTVTVVGDADESGAGAVDDDTDAAVDTGTRGFAAISTVLALLAAGTAFRFRTRGER